MRTKKVKLGVGLRGSPMPPGSLTKWALSASYKASMEHQSNNGVQNLCYKWTYSKLLIAMFDFQKVFEVLRKYSDTLPSLHIQHKQGQELKDYRVRLLLWNVVLVPMHYNMEVVQDFCTITVVWGTIGVMRHNGQRQVTASLGCSLALVPLVVLVVIVVLVVLVPHY